MWSEVYWWGTQQLWWDKGPLWSTAGELGRVEQPSKTEVLSFSSLLLLAVNFFSFFNATGYAPVVPFFYVTHQLQYPEFSAFLPQMDELFKPFLSGTTPSPPKFNVNVTWSALAPMDEKNQTPNITFGNTRAETLRFGGAGVQHSACCRVWIFCPSTVSFSDVFTSFGLQTLLWKHQCACCWSSSKLRKTLAFHK